MPVYVQRDGDWTSASDPSAHDLAIDVTTETALPDTPDVVVRQGDDAIFTLQTRAVPSGGETIHTVAAVNTDSGSGTVLFAVRAEDGRQTFDDLRPDDASSDVDDAVLEGVQDDLDEILIPVYIDDAIENLSENVPDLVLLHTARFDDHGRCTYFRTSAFRDGSLLLEEEVGALS
jgi:hypothetical protein